MKKSWMCLFNSCALKEHGRELYTSLIHGDMKQPAVYRPPIRIVGFTRASLYASHVSWTHPPPQIFADSTAFSVNSRDFPKRKFKKKKKAAWPVCLVCFIFLVAPSQCTVLGNGDSVKQKTGGKKTKTGLYWIKTEHFCNIFNSEDFMQANKS